MNETYLDIFIELPNDITLHETFPTLVGEFGFEGFLEDEQGFHCYIKKKLWDDTTPQEIQDAVAVFSDVSFSIISITELQQQNWNEEWEKTIQPIHISEKIIITPSWHPIVEEKEKIVITIDPKMSFGTGYHESTRLMLRMMEQCISPHVTVLDIGTGTGVLAIAAIKLGAASALSIDIDEWSANNGNENIDRNNLRGKVEIRTGSLEVVPEISFTIILANIIRATILELLPDMISKLAPNGFLLLSGLLAEDRTGIEQALLSHHCIVTSVLQENEWIGITAHRT